MSNRLAFFLASLILIFALVPLPATAETVSALWDPNLDGVVNTDDPGWKVTLTFEDGNAPAISKSPTIISADGSKLLTNVMFTPDADGTTTMFKCDVPVPDQGGNQPIVIYVHRRVSPRAPATYTRPAPLRRVTLINGVSLPETDISHPPKLKSITGPQYVNGPFEVTITFEDEDSDTGIGPSDGLKETDIELDGQTSKITSFSGGPKVYTVWIDPAGTFKDHHPDWDPYDPLRSNYPDISVVPNDGTPVGVSLETAKPDRPLSETLFPHQNNIKLEIPYDLTPPLITPGAPYTIPVNGRNPPQPPNGQWGAVPFAITFRVEDRFIPIAGGAIRDDRTDIDVSTINVMSFRAAPDVLSFSNVGRESFVNVDGAYHIVTAHVSVKDDAIIDAGEPVQILVTVWDLAGNRADDLAARVTLAGQNPDAVVSKQIIADSGNSITDGGSVEAGSSVTVTFDKDPGTVTMNGETIPGDGTTRTIRIPDTATGSVIIELVWGSTTQSLTYTILDTTVPTVTIGDPELQRDGTVVFVIKVSEVLGSGDDDLNVSDFITPGADPATPSTLGEREMNTGADSADYPYIYRLTVTPVEDMPVTVTLHAEANIKDVAGNPVDVATTPITATYDVTPPKLVSYTITAILDDDGDVTDDLLITLVFNEDVDPKTIRIGDRGDSDVRQIGAADEVTDEDHTYEVTVESEGHADRQFTYMELAGGVTDLAGIVQEDEENLTYESPEVDAPTVAITARPNPINCETGSTITFTLANTSETLGAGDITVSAGWRVGRNNNPSDGNIDIVPDGNNAIGVTTVTVTVAENAVGRHAAVAETFTVGPVIDIPGYSYILVIHPAHTNTSHLNAPSGLGSIPIRAPQFRIQHWECMPDLTAFFGRSAPAIRGGAIVIKEAEGPMGHDPNGRLADIARGSVGLSEIMWGSDAGIQHGGALDPWTGRRTRTPYDQTREQWIELHNRNPYAVKVTLFARPTNQAFIIEADEIDRVSNYNITTGNVWEVRGQSGNSRLGIDFVSMQRAQDPGKPYYHPDLSGTDGGKWTASTASYLENQNYSFRGTPGRSNTTTDRSTPTPQTNSRSNTIVFNEIANRRDQTLEWIELKNVSNTKVNLRRYQISLATATGTDDAFYTFPNNSNIQLEAGELLLLLDTDPRDNHEHPIAAGFNRDDGNYQALGIGNPPRADIPKYKVANFREGGLPDNGNFVLYLRNRNDRLKSPDAVIDVVGWSDRLADTTIRTQLWPLRGIGTPDNRNRIAVETVHRRQHRIDPDEASHSDDKPEHQALVDVGYTGVGYKRHAQRSAANGGTPGYEHGTPKNSVADIAATGVLTISEIMFDQGDGEYPQWIEIYNSSPTQPVNLHSEAGWRLIIENFDDGEIPRATLSGTINFKNSDVQTILPQQTVMVTSTRARDSGSVYFGNHIVFPATRVFSVWADQHNELGMQRSTDPILSTEGFYIELIDGRGNFSDGVGNLVKPFSRRGAATIEWELSEVTGEMMDDIGRSSILRRYRDSRTKHRYSDAEIENMGIEADGWIAAHKTNFRDVPYTWYGHSDDYGSPGITGGRVLPVELSKFRPERLQSGDIVIRWITQSELNNAGFNILRSEKPDGEFTQVNTKLIAGQGTTSEKTTYEWKDTTAKTNVVYYYQIQDVSLDGQVATLAQTRLKGHISPAGKATVTWGELKAF